MSEKEVALMTLVEKARIKASLDELEWVMHNYDGRRNWRQKLFARFANLEKEYEAIR